jgi:dihydropteroate synthase
VGCSGSPDRAVAHGLRLRQVDADLDVGGEPVVVDPGLRSAKSADHKWAVPGALTTFAATRFPVLVGADRKRFLGSRFSASDNLSSS